MEVARLVGPVDLKLDGHAGGSLVALGGSIKQRLVLVVGVVLGHHHVEHHAGVADAQVLPLAALELHHHHSTPMCQPMSILAKAILTVHIACQAGPRDESVCR